MQFKQQDWRHSCDVQTHRPIVVFLVSCDIFDKIQCVLSAKELSFISKQVGARGKIRIALFYWH